MDDPELEAIRQKRLAELQAQYGGQEDRAQQEQKKRQQEEQLRLIMAQVLTSEARERLNRIRVVKPEKARQVEEIILRNAQMGRLGGHVDEDKLKQLLEQIRDKESENRTKITFRRRTYFDDED